MAMKASLALGCRVNHRSILARKNYFYPDLPKGYQISQYEQPLAEDGFVMLPLTKADQSDQEETGQKRVGIIRVHLEEDAGKMIHAGDVSLLDFNRSGTPLVLTHGFGSGCGCTRSESRRLAGIDRVQSPGTF